MGWCFQLIATEPAHASVTPFQEHLVSVSVVVPCQGTDYRSYSVFVKLYYFGAVFRVQGGEEDGSLPGVFPGLLSFLPFLSHYCSDVIVDCLFVDWNDGFWAIRFHF